ncbi:SMC-N multi-domain protein [Pyrenophora tritici-repentis]|nr:SMC-N multi-domain protein [Pyrenophora tritici-repentis]
MPARSGTSSSSMHTSTSFSSSLVETSPSRHSPNRSNLRPHRESLTRDPYGSPAHKLALEFNLRLSISDREFNEKLDKAAAVRAEQHQQQLAYAAEEHERVYRSAKLELERQALEEEQARLRHEENQKREIERLKQEKAREQAEAQRRALEARQREEEAARQAAEHQKKLQEADARIKARKEQEAAAERQKKETEEAGRKAAEAAAAAEKARQQVPQQVPQQAPQQAPAAPTQAAAPKPGQAPAANVDQIHAKYLQLHQRMKEFRKAFWEEHKKPTSPLKGPVGDARRALRTRLGQINVDRTDSTAAIKRLRTECFDVALNTPGPMIDIRQYIVSHQLPQLANQNQAAYPAFLLYVWICFEKFLIGQFEKEAANPDGRIIQEIGLIAASLFGDQKYMWNGVPLTDITYAQRMRGIGAGYASMSLRSFASKTPAIAISEYWRAIASIVNTPPDQLWPGHFAILSGLIRDYHKKFIQFYGVPARAVLRRAVIDLPMRAPDRCKDAASTIAVLSESWKRENFSLD